MIFKKYLIAAFLISCLSFTYAQNNETILDTTINHSFWSKYNLSTYASGGIAVGTLAYSYAVWWKNDYRPFRFYKEGRGIFDAHLGIDKAGHFYTSYFMFHSIYDILRWGGHPENQSFWWATGVSAFHAFTVEVGDGLSEYGFDPKDLIANWSGVAYSMLQEKVPFFKNFEAKWSLYYPLERHSFKINDLYDYHIYFLSVKVNNLLPMQLEKYWPDFLQIALGYSGRDNVTTREYVLSLDYDLTKIPLRGDGWDLFKR